MFIVNSHIKFGTKALRFGSFKQTLKPPTWCSFYDFYFALSAHSTLLLTQHLGFQLTFTAFTHSYPSFIFDLRSIKFSGCSSIPARFAWTHTNLEVPSLLFLGDSDVHVEVSSHFWHQYNGFSTSYKENSFTKILLYLFRLVSLHLRLFFEFSRLFHFFLSSHYLDICPNSRRCTTGCNNNSDEGNEDIYRSLVRFKRLV